MTGSKKVTIVYTNSLMSGSHWNTLVCQKRVTVKAGESVMQAAERRGVDSTSIVLVYDGWPKSIESDWSKPL